MATTPQIPPATYAFLRAEFVHAVNGKAEVRFRPNEEMTNPYGAVQGGILAAMMDDTVGPAMFSLPISRPFTTVAMTTHYLRAVKPGDVLIGRSEVIRAGRTQALIEATLHRESDNELLAKASVTNVYLDP